MKSLMVVSLYGKSSIFLVDKEEIIQLKEKKSNKDYSTVSFWGPSRLNLLPNEIPYSNGNNTIDDMSFSFGSRTIPMISIAVEIARDLKDEIDSVYLITHSSLNYDLELQLKNDFKEMVGKDVYKGDISFEDVLFSICMILSIRKKIKSSNILIPCGALSTIVEAKNRLGRRGTYGVAYDIALCGNMTEEFHKRFSHYLNLFDEEKNYKILRGMFLAGYYGYIYENKEDDIINVYQDRKIVIPFSDIKKFIDEVLVPDYKSILNIDEEVYSFDITGLNNLFSEYKINNKFIIGQEDFLRYAKMLADFNNDLSIRPYKKIDKNFICVFNSSEYGRKSSEFFKKQCEFVEKAYKNNKKEK